MQKQNKLNIVVLLGTNRKDAQSIKVRDFVVNKISSTAGHNVISLEPKNFPIAESDYGTVLGDSDSKLQDIIKTADAYVIVMPEYNHSFSGTIKTMLDMYYGEYSKKPIGLVTVSDGPWGGVRVAESMLSVIRALGAIALKRDAQYTKASTEKDPASDADFVKRFSGMFEELLWYATVLKKGRESNNL